MTCLGRIRSVPDDRTILFEDIVTNDLPPAPMAVRRDDCVPDVTDEYANDTVGDCTVAAPAHLVEVWTEYGKFGQLLTTANVLGFYEEVSGYNPADPTTDNGADMLTVLKRWRTDGIAGHQIYAFVKVDHTNVDHVKSAINIFGGVYVGAELPRSAQGASVWSDTHDAPGSWGGHAIMTSRYDHTGGDFRTWGKLQPFTWDWWGRYVDECYAVFSHDWLHDNTAPNGLDLNRLSKYLQAVSK